MSRSEPKSPAPFSLRLTADERAQLERRAAGTPMGAYIRACLFASESSHRRITRGKAPVADHKALAQLLARLGQSRLPNNINQLARAANTGALPITQETEAALRTAAADIAAMKRLLLRALGVRERRDP
jgi:hypothetical protein